MVFNKKQINPNIKTKKKIIRFEDESADFIFKEMSANWFHSNLEMASFEILRKVLLFNGLSWKKYYKQIADLIMESENKKQIEKGINKIAKQITKEINQEK